MAPCWSASAEASCWLRRVGLLLLDSRIVFVAGLLVAGGVDLGGGVLHRLLSDLIQLIARGGGELREILRGGFVFGHPRKQLIQSLGCLFGLRSGSRLMGGDFLGESHIGAGKLQLLLRLFVQVGGLILQPVLSIADILDLLADLRRQDRS